MVNRDAVSGAMPTTEKQAAAQAATANMLERIAAADREAAAASLAFTLGPETFRAWWEQKAAETRQRMEADYNALNPGRTDGPQSGVVDATVGSGGDGGGPGGSSPHVGRG